MGVGFHKFSVSSSLNICPLISTCNAHQTKCHWDSPLIPERLSQTSLSSGLKKPNKSCLLLYTEIEIYISSLCIIFQHFSIAYCPYTCGDRGGGGVVGRMRYRDKTTSSSMNSLPSHWKSLGWFCSSLRPGRTHLNWNSAIQTMKDFCLALLEHSDGFLLVTLTESWKQQPCKEKCWGGGSRENGLPKATRWIQSRTRT